MTDKMELMKQLLEQAIHHQDFGRHKTALLMADAADALASQPQYTDEALREKAIDVVAATLWHLRGSEAKELAAKIIANLSSSYLLHRLVQQETEGKK